MRGLSLSTKLCVNESIRGGRGGGHTEGRMVSGGTCEGERE